MTRFSSPGTKTVTVTSGGQGGSDPADTIKARSVALAKERKISVEKAEYQLLKEEPTLYAQYLRENGGKQ